MKVRTRDRISSCSGARVKSIAMDTFPWVALVEADHVAVLVDVDPFGRRAAREPWHGAHVATDQIDEPGTHVGLGLAHGEAPPSRSSPQRGVRGDGEMGLGDAHGESAESRLLVDVELAGCRGH